MDLASLWEERYNSYYSNKIITKQNKWLEGNKQGAMIEKKISREEKSR